MRRPYLSIALRVLRRRSAAPRPLTWRALCPAIVTAAGLAAGLAAAALLARGELGAAASCIVAGQAADTLDGALARQLRAESALGARLDWAADTAVATALLVALGWWPLVALAVVLQAATGGRISGRTGAALAALAVARGWL